MMMSNADPRELLAFVLFIMAAFMFSLLLVLEIYTKSRLERRIDDIEKRMVDLEDKTKGIRRDISDWGITGSSRYTKR